MTTSIKYTLISVAAAMAAASVIAFLPCAAAAAETPKMTDLGFAERFAFAKDRSSLLAELPPESKAWFYHAVLLAQSEGRVDDARGLLLRYLEVHDPYNRSNPRHDPSDPDMLELWRRQALMEFGRDDGILGPSSHLHTLARLYTLFGIRYPDAQKPDKVRPGQHSAIWRDKERFDLKSRLPNADSLRTGLFPLALALGGRGLDPYELAGPGAADISDAPGMETNALALLLDKRWPAFSANATERRLTLAQLAFLRDKLEGTDRALDNNAAFVKLVQRKLARGADASPDDRLEHRAELVRILAFADTLAPGAARDQVSRTARFRLLELDRSLGRPVDADALSAYVAFPRPTELPLVKGLAEREEWHRSRDMSSFCDPDLLPPVSAADDAKLVRELLLQAFAEGASCDLFAKSIESAYLGAIVTEAALLSGRELPPQEVHHTLGDQRFRTLRDRRELAWAPGNPLYFAADAPVSLRLDIKNVPQVRVAIHDLDPFNACRDIGEEVPSNVDLEGSVPTAERSLDFTDVPALRRHTETLELSELVRPGLYVVEVSGGGLMSRALVRKGRLRTLERIGAAGHVFTVLNPDGAPAPDASLFLDGQVFAADKNGEIAVPFTSADGAKERTAIIRAGRLACVHKFFHCPEAYKLQLNALLPAESLVAGTEATLLLRPSLRVAGAGASLSLLEEPVVTLLFHDLDGVESIRRFEGLPFVDDADMPVRFVVPPRITSIRATLSAKVRNLTRGRRDDVAGEWLFSANDIAQTTRIEQGFLLRDASGTTLELRGRNGEPLPDRPLELRAQPSALNIPHEIAGRRQTDAEGRIALETLRDTMSIRAEGLVQWRVAPPEASVIPTFLSAAEGETFTIHAPGYRGEALPLRDQIPIWVSLLEMNSLRETTTNRIDAVRQGPGDTLLVGPLPAGDYELLLRATGHRIVLLVTRPYPVATAGAMLAGPVRALPANGGEIPLRIAFATNDAAKAALRVVLDGASPETRLHVVARRYAPLGADAAADDAFLRAVRIPKDTISVWKPLSSVYLSGRRLGDEAQYILDRRSRPHRPGNPLFRPSLLVSPWTAAETSTGSSTIIEDASFANEGMPAYDVGAPRSLGGPSFGGEAAPLPCFDFLRDPAVVIPNLRPDKDGAITIPLDALAGHQDLLLLASDGIRSTSLRFALPAAPLAARDLRLTSELPTDRASRMETLAEALPASASVRLPATSTTRYQVYATLSDVMRLFQAVAPDADLEKFSFLARWDALDADRRRALYSEHACHELDFFLYHKDRKFFDKVIAPNLRNKREPQFLDRWLLGEDVSAWTAPDRLGALDAFERGLVAVRHPEVATRVADAIREEAEGDRTRLLSRDRLFRTALRGIGEPSSACLSPEPADSKPFAESQPQSSASFDQADEEEAADSLQLARRVLMDRAAMPAASAAPLLAADAAPVWSEGGSAGNLVGEKASAGFLAQSMRRQNIAANRQADARRRKERAPRTFFRPVDKTREWVESDYWRVRRADHASACVKPNAFWADVADAVAAGKSPVVLSANVVEASGSFTERMAALALLDLPFAPGAGVQAKRVADDGAEATELRAGDTPVLLFREAAVPADPAREGDEPVIVLRRFFDPAEPTRVVDGVEVERAIDRDFIAGRVYGMRTVVMNPTGRNRIVSLLDEIPSGAIALTGGAATFGHAEEVAPYGSLTFERRFYFPAAGDKPFPAAPAAASENGREAGRTAPFALNVLAEAGPPDPASWEAIAADGADRQVLGYLRAHSLHGTRLDLGKIAWRLAYAGGLSSDQAESNRRDAFFRSLTDLLDEKLVYDGTIWSYAALRHDAKRFGEWIARSTEVPGKGRLGLWLRSPVIDIDPEERDLFELKEYWPLVNPRAHPFGVHPRIDNTAFAAQYRRFLDVLASKPAAEVSARDHLLAAVYLLAQDRLDEARAHAALVKPDDVRTKMQLAYLRAYLAYGDLDFQAARAAADPWRDHPVPRWRDRFRALLAACDEAQKGAAAGDAPADSLSAVKGADHARPTLSLAADGPGRARLASRGLDRCSVRAYPVDIELLFSRNPFLGKDAPNRATFVRPVWEADVELRRKGKDAPASVELPEALRKGGGNYVLEAVGAGGEAVARLAVPSRQLDVQLSPSDGTLRVRDAKGRPLPAAYVKVYARPAGGGKPVFHKDGYTDPRGVFDYANVSIARTTAEAFAILVLHDTEGALTLEAAAPSTPSAHIVAAEKP